MDCELSGFRRSLRQSQEDSENLMAIISKLESEIEFIKKQTMIINDQKDKLRETFQIYAKSLEQTEAELDQVLSVILKQLILYFFIMFTNNNLHNFRKNK